MFSLHEKPQAKPEKGCLMIVGSKRRKRFIYFEGGINFLGVSRQDKSCRVALSAQTFLQAKK
jgi:hypothetical protein